MPPLSTSNRFNVLEVYSVEDNSTDLTDEMTAQDVQPTPTSPNLRHSDFANSDISDLPSPPEALGKTASAEVCGCCHPLRKLPGHQG
jgi:hypothetical protein